MIRENIEENKIVKVEMNENSQAIARAAIERLKTGEIALAEASKQMTLTEINQMCIDNGIAFDKEEATAIIEQCIDLTKKVNKRDKDNPAAANQPP